MHQRLILGIDPGSRATGFGVVEKRGAALQCVTAGVIRTSRESCLARRLGAIYQGVAGVIEEYGPGEVAVEEVFQAKNPRSALILGHARGAAILAAANRGLEVFEYTPMEVKSAVVGYGRAEKSQVQHMVTVILGLQSAPPRDAADALAVAVCHAHSSRLRHLASVVQGGGP